MIIFGTRPRMKTIGSGTFYCPKCQTTRNYERKQGKNYFTLYFVPIFPVGDLGEFIECQTCHTTFETDVLKLKPPPPKLDLPTMLNGLKFNLESGQPVEYILRDLVSAGLERDIALNNIKTAIGDQRRHCPKCGLSYATNVNVCSECNEPLGEGHS
jgi:predicted nucleic acid-binding Zn ribbon protein